MTFHYDHMTSYQDHMITTWYHMTGKHGVMVPTSSSWRMSNVPNWTLQSRCKGKGGREMVNAITRIISLKHCYSLALFQKIAHCSAKPAAWLLERGKRETVGLVLFQDPPHARKVWARGRGGIWEWDYSSTCSNHNWVSGLCYSLTSGEPFMNSMMGAWLMSDFNLHTIMHAQTEEGERVGVWSEGWWVCEVKGGGCVKWRKWVCEVKGGGCVKWRGVGVWSEGWWVCEMKGSGCVKWRVVGVWSEGSECVKWRKWVREVKEVGADRSQTNLQYNTYIHMHWFLRIS